MKIIDFEEKYFDETAALMANFRVVLRKLKNEGSEPDLEDAKDELRFYLERKYPLYLALVDEKPVGYLLLRVDGVAWVEHIYVLDEYRRQGIASRLFAKAEEYSDHLGGDTLFNYVHPNNDAIIAFLRSQGYEVLNLIEIRKPFKGEKPSTKVKVGNHEFDY